MNDKIHKRISYYHTYYKKGWIKLATKSIMELINSKEKQNVRRKQKRTITILS